MHSKINELRGYVENKNQAYEGLGMLEDLMNAEELTKAEPPYKFQTSC